jgi:hypothetical protein
VQSVNKCKFCGVLEEYGHFDWCKIDRAPTADEIILAVIDENERCVGYEGPSETLAGMCKSYLASRDGA